MQAEKSILKYLDESDIINKEKIVSGYKKYVEKNPGNDFQHYMIDYKLKELGIKKGTALQAKFQRAYILPDESSKRDPYHIMHRMVERNVTDDMLENIMKTSKIMFSQWNGKRKTFYSRQGVVTIMENNDSWIYKTTWSKYDLDEEALKILEVIDKYV